MGGRGGTALVQPEKDVWKWAGNGDYCDEVETWLKAGGVGLGAIGAAVPGAIGAVPALGHALAKKCGAKKGSAKINKNSAPRPEWMKGDKILNPKKQIKRAGRGIASLWRGDKRNLPAGWTAQRDDDGKRFWKNDSTGETVFVKPKKDRRLRLLASAKRAGATSISDHLLRHQ